MDASTIVIAGFGGLSVNLLNLAEMGALAPDRRPNLKDPLYWLAFPIGALLAAFVGYVYLASGFEIKPVLALHIGASSPLILRAMSSAIPKSIALEKGA